MKTVTLEKVYKAIDKLTQKIEELSTEVHELKFEGREIRPEYKKKLLAISKQKGKVFKTKEEFFDHLDGL